MRITLTIVAVLIGLLSIAAGAAKVALVPEETAFLSQFGFTNAITMTFGAVQILGGLLLLIPKTRSIGAITSGLAFAVSSVLLMLGGNLAFAAVSLLPVGLAVLVACLRLEKRTAAPTAKMDA